MKLPACRGCLPEMIDDIILVMILSMRKRFGAVVKW